jgi:DNA-binding NarL/FixJ family response regulator
MRSAPVTVAVASPFPAVTLGFAGMLAGREPVQVVDVRAARAPDVVLYDVHGLLGDGGADLDRLVATTTSTVLAVRNDLRPALVAQALARGAHGSVDVASDAEVLLQAVLAAAGAAGSAPVAVLSPRLGESAGLTPREVDVLTLITQGLSNQEIAEQSYLSINSVKTYIRSAYRRIGATSRSQAVVWCVRHGFPRQVAA